jgi:hypothetical protein
MHLCARFAPFNTSSLEGMKVTPSRALPPANPCLPAKPLPPQGKSQTILASSTHSYSFRYCWTPNSTLPSTRTSKNLTWSCDQCAPFRVLIPRSFRFAAIARSVANALDKWKARTGKGKSAFYDRLKEVAQMAPIEAETDERSKLAISSSLFAPIPLSLSRSSTERNGLPSMICLAITGPTPGKDSNSFRLAVFKLIRRSEFAEPPGCFF